MKYNLGFLVKNWGPGRWLRLVAGILLLSLAIYEKEQLLGLLASWFLLQALANASCCSNNGCGTVRKTD